MNAMREGVSRKRVGARSRQRATCRRPISPDEVDFLESLAELLRALRREAQLTQQALAFRAELSESQLYRIEAGTRRTRRSTLDRLAGALVEACSGLGSPSEVADRLVAGRVLREMV